MSEKQELGKIWAITDDDTGMYQIGEVDGGFNGLLEAHVKKYGAEGLILHLAHMTNRVIEVQRQINLEEFGEAQAMPEQP